MHSLIRFAQHWPPVRTREAVRLRELHPARQAGAAWAESEDQGANRDQGSAGGDVSGEPDGKGKV